MSKKFFTIHITGVSVFCFTMNKHNKNKATCCSFSHINLTLRCSAPTSQKPLRLVMQVRPTIAL